MIILQNKFRFVKVHINAVVTTKMICVKNFRGVKFSWFHLICGHTLQLHNIINVRITHTSVWESIAKLCSCTQFMKAVIFNYKSRKNPYQVLQVTCDVSECAMKSKVCMIKSLSPQCKGIQEKTSLVCCRWHCYSCSTLVTIQTATNSWYVPVQLCTMVIIIVKSLIVRTKLYNHFSGIQILWTTLIYDFSQKREGGGV